MDKTDILGSFSIEKKPIKHFLSIMRTAFILMFTCIFCSLAEPVHTQNARVTINMRNVPIEAVLNEIETQTDYLFMYDNQVDINEKVSVKAKQAPVASVLRAMLKDKKIDYVMEGNHIVMIPAVRQDGMIAASALQQQKKQLSGTVIDNGGLPIIGANVVESGTTNGTVTDVDGKFTLQVEDKATINVSYIGYLTRSVATAGQTELTIVLQEDSEALEEVVVIGYGTVRKVDLAGSVSVMNDKNFKDQPITRIEEAFQGRISGIQVDNSGIPGGNMKIRIRGANSVNKSNDPLYIVDGMVRDNGLADINPEDIQSIQVLKDASSTAIYGSRGANGVVLVTTKTGKIGVKLISFDAQLSTSSVYKRYQLMNPYEYATAYRELKNPNAFSEQEMTAYRNGTAGVDWQDEIFRTAPTQNYKLSYSSGNKDSQYYLSANYINQQGIIKYTSNKQYQIRANITSEMTKWLHITADLNVAQRLSDGQSFSFGGNPLFRALSYSPTMEVRDSKGNYNKDPYNSLHTNPVGALAYNDHTRGNSANGHFDLRFTILPGMTFTSSNGFDYLDKKGYGANSTKVEARSNMSNNNTERLMLQSSNNLTYDFTLHKNHKITATGVYEVSKWQQRGMSISGENLLIDEMRWWNVNVATKEDADNFFSEYSMMSFLGRLLYNFNDRYLLTLTMRSDGTSKFFKKNRWSNFPSAAFAWNLGNEAFMKRQSLFSNVKLRASYGVVGNQAILPYETLGLLGKTAFAFGTGKDYTAYYSNQAAAPDLTWEKTYQVDAGADFSMFNGLLNVSFDYFRKKTEDALLKKSVPGYMGGGSFWVNAGEIENKGFEFMINATPLRNDAFSWTTTVNGTNVKNKVLSLGGDKFIYGANPLGGTANQATIVMPGHPLGSFFGYEWNGLDENGNNIYADKNGNGIIDGGDRDIIGQANPTLTMGWNNSLSWKNWDLNIFLNGSFGAKRLNLAYFSIMSMTGSSRFITLKDAYFKNFDRDHSQASAFPSLTSKTQKYQAVSTQFLESADYVRLENISLSYRLPKERIKFADLRLTLSVQNLFTITKYKGMDPAGYTFEGGNTDVNAGIDIGAYPTPRTVTFGAKFNF